MEPGSVQRRNHFSSGSENGGERSRSSSKLRFNVYASRAREYPVQNELTLSARVEGEGKGIRPRAGGWKNDHDEDALDYFQLSRSPTRETRASHLCVHVRGPARERDGA